MMLARSTVAVQSCVASPVALFGSRTSRVTQSFPAGALSRRPRSTRPQARRLTCMSLQPFGDLSLVLPSFAPILARAVTGGVLIYTVLNWVHYRRIRRETEQYIEDNEQVEMDRKKKLDRLNGKNLENDQSDQ
eukprot:jgi/Botrbrau1/1493/Bobra.178_3s0048.1